MSRFILESMLTLVTICSFGFAQETAVVAIMPGADNEMNVVIDPQIHQDYGVTREVGPAMAGFIGTGDSTDRNPLPASAHVGCQADCLQRARAGGGGACGR